MHYNIPSDKIMLFGLLTAVTIVAFFLVARLKNAGWGGRKIAHGFGGIEFAHIDGELNVKVAR